MLTSWFPDRRRQKYLYIVDQIEALVSEGVEVSVVVLRPWLAGLSSSSAGLPDAALARNFDLHVLRYFAPRPQWSPALQGPVALASVGPWLRRWLKREKPSLLHAHTSMCGFVATRLGREFALPSVVHIGGFDPNGPAARDPSWNRQFRSTLSLASRVVLVGTPLQNDLAPLCTDPLRLAVVPNGYRLPENIPSRSRVPRRFRNRLVSVSNLTPTKGIDVTVRALVELRRAGCEDVDYIVVGPGAELPRLRALVGEMGLGDRVFFLGALSHADAMAEVAAADIFCLPSSLEAFGIAHLEAMALGKVVVGVLGQGPELFITNGATGYLCPPNDHIGLAGIIQNVLADRQAAIAMGTAARKHCEENYTWRHSAKRLVELYREVRKWPEN